MPLFKRVKYFWTRTDGILNVVLSKDMLSLEIC